MLVLRGGAAALLVSAAAAITALPPWPPTYELAASTITMQCNGSGYSDPTRGAAFGIVSYDWSNDKYDWAKAAPMDCEERLLRQAQMTKRAAAGNRSTHVFVYRNLVKALPWFSSVRKILDDPAYSGFFLKFDPTKKDDELHVPRCAPESPQKCSPFYHDQEQTPEVPTSTSPHPDGSCDPTIGCDCGTQPCGEYLWDHRNGSQLRTWLMDNVIGGPTGLDAPEIDGLFIDDFWCSDMLQNTSCNDPVQGPTEIDSHSQLDMGLSDDDIRDLTLAWRQTMTLAQRTILRKGGYTWSLMSGQSNANAMPTTLSASSCAAQLRDACAGGKAESDWQTQAHIVGFSQNGTALSQVEQDVAFFSLVRGPYAWLGWGTWGMTWPFNREPAHGELPPLPHGVPRPSLLERDFGVPVDRVCREVSPGVFSRRWSLGGDIRLDCNTFEASWGGLSSQPVLDDVAIRAVNENPDTTTWTALSSRPVLDDVAIHAVNENPDTTWTAHRNPRFEGVSVEQARRLLGALNMPRSVPRTANTSSAKISAGRRTPTNFDARTQWPGCVGAVRNQLHCGGCWAFAAAETLSDRFCIATNGSINVTLSPQDLISCGHVRTPPKYLLGCDGGVPEYAWKYMEQTGISTDACIPFVNTTKEVCPIANATCDAKKFKVAAGTTRVLDGAVSAVQQFMSDPAKGGPVQAVFYVYQDFFSYKSGVYKRTNMSQAPLGKHSVKIVGYGLDETTFENYWLAANSWGGRWGMDGFFKIATGQCEIESEMVFGEPDA